MSDTSLNLSGGALLGGRYRLIAEIGRGGMASVHRAHDEVLDREVAVKVLHARLAADPAFRDRFQREARAAARLSHPNVVTVHDCGQEQDRAWLVMELVEGDSLRDVLDIRGRVTPGEALSLLAPAAAGLAAAHESGMVHLDIKPENVLYGRDGTVKVTDFGLARAAATATVTFDSGMIVGSPHYLSPEAVEGEPLDACSDVYALGVVLFECLTGQPPFHRDTPLATALAHVRESVPPPSSVVASLPDAVDQVVLRATASDPGERYPDAGAFAEALTEAVPGGPVPVDLRDGERDTVVLPRDDTDTTVTGVDGDDGSRGRWGRRRVLTVLGVLLALAAGGFGVWDQLVAPVTAVPAVTESPRDQAVAALREAGFTPEVAEGGEHHLEIPRNHVVRQSPDGSARRGDPVRLVLSLGPPQVEVPGTGGMEEAEAVEALEQAHLRPEVRRVFHERVEAGLVIRSEPEPGATVRATSTVSVVVSRGREPIEVPDLRGRPRGEAQQTLSQAGLEVSVTGREFHEEVPAGAVISQSPAPGERLFRGDTVQLVLSKGAEPFPMPDVLDLPEERARRVLGSRGLGIQVEELDTNNPQREGTVADQKPPAGTKVRRGDTVTIVVWD